MGHVNVSQEAIDHLKSIHQATFERERPLAIEYSRPVLAKDARPKN